MSSIKPMVVISMHKIIHSTKPTMYQNYTILYSKDSFCDTKYITKESDFAEHTHNLAPKFLQNQ